MMGKLVGLTLIAFGFLAMGVGGSKEQIPTLIGVALVVAGLVITWSSERTVISMPSMPAMPTAAETVEVVCPKCRATEHVPESKKFEVAAYKEFVAAKQGKTSVVLGCKRCGHGFSLGASKNIGLGA